MQLLRDNLTLWTSDISESGQEDQQQQQQQQQTPAEQTEGEPAK